MFATTATLESEARDFRYKDLCGMLSDFEILFLKVIIVTRAVYFSVKTGTRH